MPHPAFRPAAVLLAGGDSARLHELAEWGPKAALALAGRRLADWAAAAAVAAGLPRLHLVAGDGGEPLAQHLAEAFAGRIEVHLAPASPAGTVASLAPFAEAPLLVLPADQVHALDLGALLDAHALGGAAATLAVPARGARAAAPVALAPGALAGARGGDLWADALPALGAGLARWEVPADAPWLDVDTLDDLREAARAAAADPALAHPPAAGPLEEHGPGHLCLDLGGLRLTAPRLGATRSGRWTLLEDSVILPGARVAPGARLSRAVVAPGAVVPANLVVGEDPGEDARWFRVTPDGTTLVTAPMLSRRAAHLMRESLGPQAPLAIRP